jgi:hypothetical protein
MPDFDGEKLNSAQKIFKKIQDSLDYESGYHAQAFEAYNIYSNLYALLKGHRKGTDIDYAIETLLHNNRRSNIYYANVETLKGLILPQIPSLQLSLNPSKKTANNKENKNFYNTCINILSVIVKNAIDNMDTGVWDAFKLDYIITGRGVLWASVDEDKEGNKTVSIDNVRWQDFAMDTKPTWESVSWVARRRLYTKRQFKELFNVSEDKISGVITLDSVYGDVALFDSFGDNSPYIEVWEYWDKPTLTQYYVSKQYNVEADSDSSRYIIEKKKYEDAQPDYFLPTVEPPRLMYNGINLIPFSDVWTYINELTELSQITQKRSNLINSLHLRGYTDTARANVINALSSSTHNGLGLEEDDNIVAVPGFTPNPQDPLIYYVDNMPRLQLLDFLQKEYQFLVERIYSLTGISEQMRNVTSNEDDETATSVRLKSKFGSRRLKEHQQRLLNYWVGILKILLHRICQSYEIKDLKDIFSYDFRDSAKADIQEVVFERAEVVNQLKAVQAQMQQQQQQPQEQQGQDQGQPQADQQQGAMGGGFPPPDESGGMPQPQPMQAQPEQNQNQAQGMPGAQLPDATVMQQGVAADQDQDQQSPNPTTPFGTMGQPTEQTGVDEDQQDAMAQQQAMQQNGGAAQPMADQSQADQTQQQPDLNAQNEQLLQQEMQLSEKYEALMNEVTWERIIKFFREDKFVSFLVTAHLDDLENKIISDEKKNSDLEYMNTIVNLVNQIIANVNNNPKFADIYCSIFSLSLDNFDQTKSQRDAIDEFISQIKNVAENLINNPPQQPPPSPEDQKNQAAAQELQAKAQLIMMQAQELQVKIQMMQEQSSQPSDDGGLQNNQMMAQQEHSSKMQELQMKHQMDMQIQQAKIAADQAKYQDKMESDRQLLQMKIQADKERYDEKIKADYLNKNINDQTPGNGQGYPPIV